MTLGERIRHLIKTSRFRNISAFHRELVNVFENNAVNRRTLSQIINGHALARERTLNQIAIILGLKTSELRSGTNAQILKPAEALGAFTYNELAFLQAMQNHLPFMPCQLTLKKDGRTSEEQDRPQAEQSVKWCVVASGRVNFYLDGDLGRDKKTFRKGDSFSFDARRRHYFENACSATTRLYIIHAPAQNSDFFITQPPPPFTPGSAGDNQNHPGAQAPAQSPEAAP